MKRARKAALALYVIAGIVVLTAFAALLGPAFVTDPLQAVRRVLTGEAGRIALLVCCAIVALHVLTVLVALLFDKPEPACMRLGANPNIEVSVDALCSTARLAASGADVLVENVEARVVGRDKSGVDVRVEAIALTQRNLEGLARSVQAHVQAACDEMLGVPGVRVRVCFLPSKTVTVTKEVLGE